nr:uncharacterized protein LOC127295633 [Lolium perenne]
MAVMLPDSHLPVNVKRGETCRLRWQRAQCLAPTRISIFAATSLPPLLPVAALSASRRVSAPADARSGGDLRQAPRWSATFLQAGRGRATAAADLGEDKGKISPIPDASATNVLSL